MGATCCTDHPSNQSLYNEAGNLKRADSRTQRAQETQPYQVPDTLGSKRAIRVTSPDSRQHPADRSYVASELANIPTSIRAKLGSEEICSWTFCLEKYRNQPVQQPLVLTMRIKERFFHLLKLSTAQIMSISSLQESPNDPASRLIAEVMQFKFSLTEFPGQTNTVLEHTDRDGNLYYGQGVKDSSSGQVTKEGRGFLLSESGSLFAGYFCDDRPEGPGALLITNMDVSSKPPSFGGSSSPRSTLHTLAVYTGYWEVDGMEGEGSVITSAGYQYVGRWRKQFQDGLGTEKWPDGSKYTGHFKMGQKHGHGEFVWNSRGRYVGEFRLDTLWGVGTFEWLTGNKYVGEWQDNFMHGQGQFVWLDGMKYTGAYVNGKKHGFGVLDMNDGYRWEGEWSNGRKEGKGVLYTPQGDRILGTWKNDEWIQSPHLSHFPVADSSTKNEQLLNNKYEASTFRA